MKALNLSKTLLRTLVLLGIVTIAFSSCSKDCGWLPKPPSDTTKVPKDTLLPFYEYYSEMLGDHFYTTGLNEIGPNGNIYYKYVGIAFNIYKNQAEGTVPFYRYYSKQLEDHFYTTSLTEIGPNGNIYYKYEGLVGYIYDKQKTGAKQLWRYYNKKEEDHYYTTNKSDSVYFHGQKYNLEGSVGWVK